MKAKELYFSYRAYAGDFDSYWEPETDCEGDPNIMLALVEVEHRLRHATAEVARMKDPEQSDEVEEHTNCALSDLRYIRDTLDILQVMRILDEGEGDDLFWHFLRRLSWTDYQNLYSFCTQVRKEAEKVG